MRVRQRDDAFRVVCVYAYTHVAEVVVVTVDRETILTKKDVRDGRDAAPRTSLAAPSSRQCHGLSFSPSSSQRPLSSSDPSDASSGAPSGVSASASSRKRLRNTRVAAGLGAGIVIASEHEPHADLVTLPLGPAAIEVTEYAVCLRGRRRLSTIRAFLDLAAEMADASAP